MDGAAERGAKDIARNKQIWLKYCCIIATNIPYEIHTAIIAFAVYRTGTK